MTASAGLFLLFGCLTLHSVHGVCKTGALTVDEQAVLDEHNKLRKQHQDTPEMCYAESGDDVTFTSQAWAEDMATIGEFKHSKAGEYGENIAYKSTSGDLPGIQEAYKTSTNNWYNEIKDWNFATNKGCPGKVTGHFTQLVWKAAVQLNCGHATAIADTGKKYYVVCQYFAKGNFGGPEDYEAQVGNPVEGYTVDANECNHSSPVTYNFLLYLATFILLFCITFE